jgi:hypothetical protein
MDKVENSSSRRRAMDPIREFIEGLDSVDLVGTGRTRGGVVEAAARVINGISFYLGGALTVFLAVGTLFGLAVSASFIRVVFG